MRSIRPSSWSELTDALFEGAWDVRIERFRSHEAFRGLSHDSYALDTSLARLGGSYDKLEPNLLRNFRKYAHREAGGGDSVWNWLAVAQHHGLPTRLLDWTYSAYVALHFATSNVDHFGVDGVVWCVDYVGTHRLLPPRLKAILREEGSNVFTAELLGRSSRNLSEFDRLSRTDSALFFEPPSLDDRIVNQSALFSVMSDSKAVLSRWLSRRPKLVRRVLVPADLKWEVRDKLDELNITERVLFPGLDGLTAWLARYYGPRK